MAPLPRSRFDHPLSSRFEEMDCIAVFDDVLVPWDRVMVDGSPGSAEIINALGADYGALLNVQTAARMLSQLEFFCGLAHEAWPTPSASPGSCTCRRSSARC